MACQNSNRYGFSDWYAPSLSELLLVEQFSGLDSNQYFSSTTVDTEFAGSDWENYLSNYSFYDANLINSFKILDHYATYTSTSTIVPGNEEYYYNWGLSLNIIMPHVRAVRAF